MKQFFITSAALFLSAISLAQTKAPPVANSLQAGFAAPPNAARPRVWWHWMNGNITKEGIRKDLEWMHRSGIGGFQNFDAALLTPKITDKRLVYMTPEWKEAFRFATVLADSLQLEMAIAGSPGWSVTGGPWVPPQNGMKKLVWREVQMAGGQPFAGKLPEPFMAIGPFQNIAEGGEGGGFLEKSTAVPAFYRDIAVVAYRLPDTEFPLATFRPLVTSSGGTFSWTQLNDGDLAATELLPRDTVTGAAWIQYAFPQPVTVRALSVTGGGTREPWGIVAADEGRVLEVSDDGVSYRRVATIPMGAVAQQTISIPVTKSRYFRIHFPNPPAPSNFGGILPPQKAPAGTRIAELVLHGASRINHAEEKAGFGATYELSKFPTPTASDAIAASDVLDLTAKMNADGTLRWTPPPGNWKVVRFGYSLTGKKNHPAPTEATGLEVDKLDRDAVRDYFLNYLNQYKDASGGLMGARGLQYMVIDSYEAGQENWTPKMTEEFQKRRGYSLVPWLPVLTGAVIGSTAASEQFLWDWRTTISELIAENHYDQLTGILKEYGMKRYSESHENGRLYIVDGMDVKRTAAVPMSAIWASEGFGSTLAMAQADIRESASVAHIYGQNLAAAESLTAMGMGGNAWNYSPEKLKPTADLALANGLNRFVIHTSVHQPLDNKVPGLGLGPFGQWFNRHDTWAGNARAWTDYLSRSSYMLQQGRFVADILYYYGEDNNITGLYGARLPQIPEGFNYDFINAHALINLLEVKNGRLITPSGMQYRMLVLDSNSRAMTLQVARKLEALVRAGAVVVGPKPTHTPSMKDDQAAFAALIEALWGANAGAGKVRTKESLREVLRNLEVEPDFTYTKPQADSKLLFVHRTLPNAEVYWVNNRSSRHESLEARFRTSGKEAEIWHPETGRIEKPSYSFANGITTVPLQLLPHDAVFVVFRNPTTKNSYAAPKTVIKQTLLVTGSWNVSFQQGRGAPVSATFDKLQSFASNSDMGIRYFSGTATYAKTVEVPVGMLAGGNHVQLDMGEVKNIAVVRVNGKEVGTMWKAPFVVDITSALKAGTNTLEVQVTNLWVNRLIGDQQPNVKEKITYTTMPFYKADHPLLPSGLLGPVKLVAISR